MAKAGKRAFIGISRHRIGIDGVGVTTLAAFHGCPLSCKYCLNDSCHGPIDKLPQYTPEELYRIVGVDNLYFLATHGGVCFGGGEPLLNVDYISEFRDLCGRGWNITIETSLNVSREAVEAIAEIADDFIVDIKDTDPEIYRAYTGMDNQQALDNLRWLLAKVGASHIIVRVPSIPGYNTAEDTAKSAAMLQQMGVIHIDQFDYIVEK